MNRNNEDFLNAYKAYEATAIKVNGSANIYEDDNQCTVTGNKLKLCRTVRNYLSHNGDGNTFVTATTNMADFLRGETTNILKAQLTVEKVLKKQKALSKKEDLTFIIIGNWDSSSYGKNLKHKYSKYNALVFPINL